MPQCELCGKETELISVIIEGVNIRTCLDCGKHGQVAEAPQRIIQKEIPVTPEIIEDITKNFSFLIKKARETINLTQKEYAKKLGIKESILQKLENNKHKPSLDLAKKIEAILHINLIEKIEESKESFKTTSSESLTIGDIIKKKIKL